MRSVIIRLIIIAVFILLGSYLYFRPHSTPIDTASVTIEHVSLYHYFSGPLSGGMEETVSIINSYSENDKILANALDHEAFKSLILSNLAKGDPPEDAIAKATLSRFRPITLTTLTTFLGVTPLILETSVQAQFLIPTAVSLGFGVLFASVLQMLLVPAYASVHAGLRKRRGQAQPTTA